MKTMSKNEDNVHMETMSEMHSGSMLHELCVNFHTDARIPTHKVVNFLYLILFLTINISLCINN
jgi:hypothetical protein